MWVKPLLLGLLAGLGVFLLAVLTKTPRMRALAIRTSPRLAAPSRTHARRGCGWDGLNALPDPGLDLYA